jgi:hypothetical protein
MARYIQRIALLGRERWIGWEIDGVGTEVPGLTLAEEIPDAELRAHGVKEFRPMPFESFLGLGAALAPRQTELLDEDLEFRLDALQVGLGRIRDHGHDAVPRAYLDTIFGDTLEHPRVQERLRDLERGGVVKVVGSDECYLQLTARP